MVFATGQKVRIAGKNLPDWVTVDFASPAGDDWQLYVQDDSGTIHKIRLTAIEAVQVTILTNDGNADSARVLAGLWTRWMSVACSNSQATLLASTPLRPYPHQSNAVYGAMLPQPRLRFLLADEPGTGKTIMAGLYLREMQKLGFVRRALVVAPAGLVSKWQADFERFFGGALRRITNETIQQHGLAAPHDMWVVSLELAAMNPLVQDAIRPDRAGWDIVVFDEAHRLTPTAETFHRVAGLLGNNTPRALFMTATPHRGSEWLFQHLLHLVDPDVYPHPGDDKDVKLRPLRPVPIHFLRRMKEDLVDYDGKTRLFKGRRARNELVPLNGVEDAFYREALDLVDAYFPATAVPLARLVYGKRAASSLHALTETLKRRRDGMGSGSTTAAAQVADPHDEDPWAANEARVIAESSKAAKAEKAAINGLLGRLTPLLEGSSLPVSKWRPLIDGCLAANGIRPGNGEQAVIFTEYADSADWIAARLIGEGFTARRYSGRDPHPVRDQVRAEFTARQFQIIVSTDAGNEGIDLQSAHVLVNYDIPWSLVRLEQRMGRIHRVGQTRDVELYNLVAQGTREGEVLRVLLEHFVAAANLLDGQMFDSLSLVAELVELNFEGALAAAYDQDEGKRLAALTAVRAITRAQVQAAADQARKSEAALAAVVDVAEATTLLNADTLNRINPAIVESYLTRLRDAGLLAVEKSAAGEGILHLKAREAGPFLTESDAAAAVLVATSGKALTEARAHGAVMADAITLGPGEPAFGRLLTFATRALAPDVFRGGLVADPTGIDDYDLFAFEADLVEAGGERNTAWSVLIRVDSIGARQVRWETLANLVPSSGTAGPPHPGRALDARSWAEHLAAEEQGRRRQAVTAWLAKAAADLRRLPGDLSRDIPDQAKRVGRRKQLEANVASRIDGLRHMADTRLANFRQVAHVRVVAQGIPAEPTEKDSERIAMKRVSDLLASQGWRVADVSTDGRGYDLHALRGQAQRCVEVKGVWESAASNGIRMTGNEILIATQQRGDYWLYVIDRCADGTGTMFGVYRDPIAVFDGLIKGEAIYKVPGSALKAAVERGVGE